MAWVRAWHLSEQNPGLGIFLGGWTQFSNLLDGLEGAENLRFQGPRQIQIADNFGRYGVPRELHNKTLLVRTVCWFQFQFSYGLKAVCRLKQTCTPLGAARKYVTTITDVHILNHAVSLETCRITTNTQGVWKCKVPLASLSLKMLAKSAILMSDLEKMPWQNLIVWHLGSSPATNWVSFDLNVSCSSCWGYSLINTLKLKK